MTAPDLSHRIEGKTALVTGAARGIGAACATTLARAGGRVVVTDVLESQGRELVAQIREEGGEALFQPLDVTREDQWRDAVAGALDGFGGLDVLVNNAGIEVIKPIVDTGLDDWRRVQSVNLEGVFLGVREAASVMRPGGRAGRGGAIVNISSVAGIIGIAAASAYSAAKAGVRVLTKAAAVEFGRLGYGVRVNSVHPGLVTTQMGESALRSFVGLGFFPDEDEAARWATGVHPLGRFGEPRDIAAAVLFLSSDASRWVTGSELAVDGGWTAH